jgi:hypothetical protein
MMTVLATLATRFEKLTLQHLLDELTRWSEMRLSRFQLELSSIVKALSQFFQVDASVCVWIA